MKFLVAFALAVVLVATVAEGAAVGGRKFRLRKLRNLGSFDLSGLTAGATLNSGKKEIKTVGGVAGSQDIASLRLEGDAAEMEELLAQLTAGGFASFSSGKDDDTPKLGGLLKN